MAFFAESCLFQSPEPEDLPVPLFPRRENNFVQPHRTTMASPTNTNAPPTPDAGLFISANTSGTPLESENVTSVDVQLLKQHFENHGMAFIETPIPESVFLERIHWTSRHGSGAEHQTRDFFDQGTKNHVQKPRLQNLAFGTMTGALLGHVFLPPVRLSCLSRKMSRKMSTIYFCWTATTFGALFSEFSIEMAICLSLAQASTLSAT